MPSYPSISFSVQMAAPVVKDGVVVDRSMAGVGKGRNLWTAKKYGFTLAHAAVTTADKNTLETFYDANRATSVTITWVDGTARTCIMTNWRLEPVKVSGGERWNVAITAEQV